MRSFLIAAGLLAVLCSAPAHAQFANRSIGVSTGYMKLNDAAGLDWGIPLGGFFSFYLENGFEFITGGHVMLLEEAVSRKYVIGVTPTVGIRYLFAQERFRPYVGLDIAYLHIFDTVVTQDYAGLGPNLGVDLFFSDTWSVGLRGQVNVYLRLNEPTQTSLDATVVLATYY